MESFNAPTVDEHLRVFGAAIEQERRAIEKQRAAIELQREALRLRTLYVAKVKAARGW